jgi:hypothetical protein
MFSGLGYRQQATARIKAALAHPVGLIRNPTDRGVSKSIRLPVREVVAASRLADDRKLRRA